MRRLYEKLGWTFVLTLVLGVASVVSLPDRVSANSAGGGLTGDGGDITPGLPSSPDPGATGDPDWPSVSSQNGARPGTSGRTTGFYRTQPAGEPTAPMANVWMMRVRVALYVMKAYWVRF